MSLRILVVSALVVTVGCQDQGGGKTSSAPGTGAAARGTAATVDPVELLKRVVSEGEKKSASTVWKLDQLTYDVRKTDSLVSPYTGKVRFLASYTLDGLENKQIFIIEYAFQDKKWVQTSATRKSAQLTDDIRYPGMDAYDPLSGTYAHDLAECFRPQ